MRKQREVLKHHAGLAADATNILAFYPRVRRECDALFADGQLPVLRNFQQINAAQ